jgi:hypothetical protein
MLFVDWNCFLFFTAPVLGKQLTSGIKQLLLPLSAMSPVVGCAKQHLKKPSEINRKPLQP